MATERVWPDLAIPPGEFLAETLEDARISQAALAKQMDRPAQAINEIVRGKKEITPETALQLEAALGIPAHIWTRLEADYQLTKARLASGGVYRPAAVGGGSVGRSPVFARSAWRFDSSSVTKYAKKSVSRLAAKKKK
jgi:addiction module HigA family antidote